MIKKGWMRTSSSIVHSQHFNSTRHHDTASRPRKMKRTRKQSHDDSILPHHHVTSLFTPSMFRARNAFEIFINQTPTQWLTLLGHNSNHTLTIANVLLGNAAEKDYRRAELSDELSQYCPRNSSALFAAL